MKIFSNLYCFQNIIPWCFSLFCFNFWFKDKFWRRTENIQRFEIKYHYPAFIFQNCTRRLGKTNVHQQSICQQTAKRAFQEFYVLLFKWWLQVAQSFISTVNYTVCVPLSNCRAPRPVPPCLVPCLYLTGPLPVPYPSGLPKASLGLIKGRGQALYLISSHPPLNFLEAFIVP